MSMELKDRIQKDLKKRNITPQTVKQTFLNSLNGVRCYAKDGKSIILYLVGVILEILFAILFNVNGLEWILIIVMLGIILSVELLNTAIEAVCDAVSKEFNPYIKIAKDCGSGATFVVSTVTVILNLIIFIPKIF